MLSKYLKKFREQYLVYLIFFLIPLQTRYFLKINYWKGDYWEYTSLFIYATEILILMTLILNFQNLNKTKIKTFAILSLLPALSIFFAWNISYMLFAFIHYLLAASILLLPKIKPTKLLLSLILSALGQSILVFKQFITQNITAHTILGVSQQLAYNLGTSVVSTTTKRILRVYAIFPHPNILGGFLTISILACLYLYIKGENTKIKLFVLISLPILTLALILSFSRSATISLFLSSLLLIYFFRTKAISIITILFISSIIFLTILYPIWKERIDFTNNKLEQKSITERINSISYNINKISITGIGYNNYTYYLSIKNPHSKVWDYQPIHNIFLLNFMEWGIVLTILFWSIIFLLIFFKNKKPFPKILFTSLLLIGLFDHYLITQFSGLMMLFSIIYTT